MAQLAIKPPMGWNHWNTFGWSVTETDIYECVDYLADNGFREAGYEFVTIDDCWMAGERGPDGELVADPKTFPHGMKALGDYIHSKGFKFGIYEDGGVRTCAGRPGSYGHEREDAAQFASWGVDFLKYDFCYVPAGADGRLLFRRMGQALRETGRDIVFSACWSGGECHEWARTAGAHMWRLSGDIFDNWKSISATGYHALDMSRYSGPMGWNDPDMLVAGLFGEGYVGRIGGGSTLEEYTTHFALWCILSAPLFLGHDLRKTTPEIKELLLNPEMIAINQDDACIPGWDLPCLDEFCRIAAKPLANGDIAILLVNGDDCPRWVGYSFESCGWSPSDKIFARDVIRREDIGVLDCGGSCYVPSHGCKLLRCTRVKS